MFIAINMATRSGKTYHQECKGSRKRTIKDTSTILHDKCIDDNLDISSISIRDLRSRHSSIKNSTFDKSDTSIVRNDINNSTESNWIVSELSCKKTRKQSNTNTILNESTACIIENKPKTNLKVSNKSASKLKKQKQHSGDSTFNKSNEIIDTTNEKENKNNTLDMQCEISAAMQGKDTHRSLKSKNYVLNTDNLEKDTENDVNSLNISKPLRKKKIKGSKKKKMKGKPNESVEKTPNIIKTINTTFENDVDTNDAFIDKTHNISNNLLQKRSSIIKDTTIEKQDKLIDTTYEKDVDSDSTDIPKRHTRLRNSNVPIIINKNDKVYGTLEKDQSTSFNAFKKGAKLRRSSISEDNVITSIHCLLQENVKNKSSPLKRMPLRRQTIDLSTSSTQNLNTTYEKPSTPAGKRTSLRLSQPLNDKMNTTFDKEETKINVQDSIISSDNSTASRFSLTSDDSTENIINATPVLIESSIDETLVKESPKNSPIKVTTSQTPLKREGTFTKEAPEVQSPQTPSKHQSSIIPPAGFTPYHVSKSSQKKHKLNVTQSIEKRLSIDPGQRMTRVMFCSPIDHPVTQEKRKIIKSNLKGSNKSFVFDENASVARPPRKRSYTQSDVDDARVKRSRLTEDLQLSVDRLSRPRTASTNAKVTETTPKKANIPYKSKSETKLTRTRLPNFAALHQKQFDKMESLGECQERKAKRARQMLTPTGSTNVLDRISPKNYLNSPKPGPKEAVKPKDKLDTPPKKLPTLDSLRPGFTRFGFKLNLDVNPFSIPPKTKIQQQPKNGLIPKAGPLPSLTGATSGRRVAAKQTVMREKISLEKRKALRNENRTIIKGVRTNRRFELQMKLRNVE